MTPYTHLTDNEVVTLVEFWPTHRPSLTALECELAARLANAVETIQDNEDNLAKLQAKYGIPDDDLWDCTLPHPVEL